MSASGGPGGASFYALGPEFEWLASAWEGFARDLAETSGILRHIVGIAAADPRLAAESSGLAALESATDRLVRELVEDAARIRRTLATYDQADAAVHASVTSPRDSSSAARPVAPPQVQTGPTPLSLPTQVQGPATSSAPARPGGAGASATAKASGVPKQVLWHPETADKSESAGGTASTEAAKIGTLSRVRRDILDRATRWVDQKIPYSQESWHEGYRTDCSGYVSMCWGLHDSLVTSTMPQIAHQIGKDRLQAGDVLLNTDVATGHVVLFDRWADYSHNSYVGYELTPGGTLHHVIPYPYFSGFGDFEPYRYNSAGD